MFPTAVLCILFYSGDPSCRALSLARHSGASYSRPPAEAAVEAAAAAAATELAAAKAKAKAAEQIAADTRAQLQAAESAAADAAAAQARELAAGDEKLREANEQLESGRPDEQRMFELARAQAKRDEEVAALRQQMRSLREMLKESHKVLKHLMRQEQLLKDELAQTRRAAKLSETLNVEYLKNIVVSFLVKVYGDADDDEHVKLARVLQTVLQFTPAESARVDEKIDAYLSSWWHRTADLLKPVPAATSWWDGWFGGGGAEATERSTVGNTV